MIDCPVKEIGVVRFCKSSVYRIPPEVLTPIVANPEVVLRWRGILFRLDSMRKLRKSPDGTFIPGYIPLQLLVPYLDIQRRVIYVKYNSCRVSQVPITGMTCEW